MRLVFSVVMFTMIIFQKRFLFGSGIMKFVGEALEPLLQGDGDAPGLPLIGVATYGIVDGREMFKERAMVEYMTQNPQALDKNHTHFFLVDDGSEVCCFVDQIREIALLLTQIITTIL